MCLRQPHHPQLLPPIRSTSLQSNAAAASMQVYAISRTQPVGQPESILAAMAMQSPTSSAKILLTVLLIGFLNCRPVRGGWAKAGW